MKKILLALVALALGTVALGDHHEEQAIGELIDNFHAAAAAAIRSSDAEEQIE